MLFRSPAFLCVYMGLAEFQRHSAGLQSCSLSCFRVLVRGEEVTVHLPALSSLFYLSSVSSSIVVVCPSLTQEGVEAYLYYSGPNQGTTLHCSHAGVRTHACTASGMTVSSDTDRTPPAHATDHCCAVLWDAAVWRRRVTSHPPHAA